MKILRICFKFITSGGIVDFSISKKVRQDVTFASCLTFYCCFILDVSLLYALLNTFQYIVEYLLCVAGRYEIAFKL